MPDVTYDELRSAFSAFGSHVKRLDCTPQKEQLCDRCRCLDIVYAIECGLKALVLRRAEYRVKDTSALGNLRNHDLNSLLSTCNLKKFHLSSIQLNNHPTGCKTISSDEFHQALRYGMKIPKNQLKQLCDAVDVLYTQIEMQIKGR